MIKVRIKRNIKKNNKINELSKEEENYISVGIDPDIIGIPRGFKRLSKGITEESIEVSDDEIYIKAKKIKELNLVILNLSKEIKLLRKKRDKLKCKKLSTDAL